MLVISIVSYAIHVYCVIMLAYCICSWFPGSRGDGAIGKAYRLLGKVVDPFLNIFRKLIPPIGGTIDISPIIAMFVLEAAGQLITRLLLSIIV